jgi:hypothetical protein
MPALPELEVVQEVFNRRSLGQAIERAEAIPPGAAVVLRDLTGAGFVAALTGARFDGHVRRRSFLLCAHAPSPVGSRVNQPAGNA